MQEQHKKAIQNNFSSLVEQTDLDVIVQQLFEKGVFSEAMIDPYRDTNKDVRTRKRLLYSDIQRRGPLAFGHLLDALTETGHWNLVRDLDNENPLHLISKRTVPSARQSSSNEPGFISLNKQKGANRTEELREQASSSNKIPYPLDFSQPSDKSTETPSFQVIKSTKFHEQKDGGRALYPTRSRHRGILIAFSFIEFLNNLEDYRTGAEVDCKNLKYLFGEMGFRPIFYNNLTKAQTDSTIDALKDLEDMELGRTECVFVLVSSHGYEGKTSDTDLRCSDGLLLSTRHIIDQFNNRNSPRLLGVPKVFIFQSCRGSSDDVVSDAWPQLRSARSDKARGPRTAPRPEQGDPRSAPPHERLYSDILIAHSTLPGFVSRRDPQHGSWYVQALCEVFAARAHDTDVVELLTLVDARLHQRFGPQTSSVDNWGFGRLLYLHPGLYEDQPAPNKTPSEVKAA